MDRTKYIGMDVHQASISIAVSDASGKLVMESLIETKAATILDASGRYGAGDARSGVADGGWCGDRAGGGVGVGPLCAVAVIRRYGEGSDGIRRSVVSAGHGRNDGGIHTGAAGGED